jgi:2-polyprenyl-3-methyl-5-hydroxy-6-metoxy-1,4-benzoquinol methylase
MHSAWSSHAIESLEPSCMKNKADGYGYNERLFDGGIRAFLHTARFRFVRDAIRKHSIAHGAVLELGCFDGKLIDFLPEAPRLYRGFDANWEGGLEIAARRWANCPEYRFEKASTPADIELCNSEQFPLSVSMETLEHVPPNMVDGYLEKLSRHTRGHLIVTVPNEKGVLFLAKWLAKAASARNMGGYTAREVCYATFGRLHHVTRREHKGFDYDVLIRQVDRHFDVLEVTGHPFQHLPMSLAFGIGVVARSRIVTALTQQ